MKILECRSVVPGCNFVTHGESKEEVMLKAAEHVRSAHDVAHMSEELRAKIHAAIREE
ncbi:DUF1059 domain-containing protein [Rhodospirillaceae bacterium SYSU D60014]|uniref:DUF1059 domain-containing protein n=1 Tax=Virgifigura deserti TaxID=2268457 RepID=UPI000E66ADCE